jgi:hypothetical protein
MTPRFLALTMAVDGETDAAPQEPESASAAIPTSINESAEEGTSLTQEVLVEPLQVSSTLRKSGSPPSLIFTGARLTNVSFFFVCGIDW